jgi:hypothetical protein
MKFEQNTAYCCATREEYDKLMKKLEELGYKWRNGENPTELHCFGEYEDTCVKISFGELLSFSNKSFYESIGIKVINVSDLFKTEFKVGDRVKLINSEYGISRLGKTGIIKKVDSRCFLKVEFDDKTECYILSRCLEKIETPQHPHITITTDGKSTAAKLYENDKITKTAESKCNLDDKFDFEVGAKIAFERLVEPKPREFKVGDIIEIIDNSKVYINYLNSTPYLYNKWKNAFSPSNGMVAKVIKIEPYCYKSMPPLLYCENNKNMFIISTKGVRFLF